MKILILKLGYSETLDPEIGKVVSLGDVVRCSVILEALKDKYPHSHISWLVAQEALPLVIENPYIDRVLVWDEFIPFALMREHYDMVVNLEKLNGICALADMIQAWEKVGFRLNAQSGEYDTYVQGFVAKNYIQDKASGGKSHGIWQKIIVEMVGCEWRNQEYSLGYKPVPSEKFAIGLNHFVGSKWPTKAMSKQMWDELAGRLEQENLSYSWQQGMSNLYEYMDWISGCEVLISSDSLGVHLALAMGKSVIVLFGSTSGEEVYLYERGKAIYPKVDKVEYECIPCYKSKCFKDKHCMESIDFDEVMEFVRMYLKKSN